MAATVIAVTHPACIEDIIAPYQTRHETSYVYLYMN